MNTYKGTGQRLSYTAGSDLSASAVVVIGDMIGILVADIASGASGAVEVTGDHVLAATAADSWSQGVQLYWNATTEKLTDTASGNEKAGRAAADKAALATTARVLLNDNA